MCKTNIQSLFKDSISIKQKCVEQDFDSLIAMGDAIISSIMDGGKLLLCGNGGSAADAQHLAAELLVRLRPNYNRAGLPAISLSLDTSTITACGNDFSYEDLFARALESIGKSGDCLLGISTSGNSQNIINAMKLAKDMKIKNFGFLGSGGGEAIQLCDEVFLVPSNVTGRIQECHITAGHALMEYIEDGLIKEKIYTPYIMDIEEIDALVFDFDGVLTNNKVYVNQDGLESVCCSRADGLAFDALKNLIFPYIFYLPNQILLLQHAKKLKVPVIQGVESKIDSLKSLCSEYNYNSNKMFFVGNDLNDFQVMEYCGFSACPSDSHDLIKEISTFVCSSKGGDGIARELLEVIFNLNLFETLY